MIPGLPPLPPHLPGLPQPQLLPLLQQAWLSRANTSVANSFIQSSLASSHASLGFPFHNPFLPPSQQPASPPDLAKHKLEPDTAEDLSNTSKRFRQDGAVCPICNIAMKTEELPEHFETELACLDSIRSLSPIAAPSRPYSASPAKSHNSSLSPTSPAHLEDRWQRFERIRAKRRERVRSKAERGHTIAALLDQKPDQQQQQEREADIDIGDSGSDCGSALSDTENNTYGPLHYTEADVLRACEEGNESMDDSKEENNSEDENANTKLLQCPVCPGKMRTPVLNTACWHLKCEKCWLKAVGTKKVCSVCGGPASVKELRKVQV